MHEHDNTTRLPERGAIDIDDFVFAATGARVRRLTTPDGEHWFPAVDVATRFGYVNTRQALLHHVPTDGHQSLEDLARSVYGATTSRRIAGHGLKKSMRMVNLRSLILLVNQSPTPPRHLARAQPRRHRRRARRRRLPGPALVRGPAACRLEDVAARTGLTLDRVHDCVRMLIRRGCVRQTGSAADGVPVYTLA
ncbi:BRO family protein [Streptomyces sp. NPDC001091]